MLKESKYGGQTLRIYNQSIRMIKDETDMHL